MLRSLLVELVDGEEGKSLLGLGLEWARRFEATAIGLAVVNERDVLGEPALHAVGHHWHASVATPARLAERRAERMLRDFSRRCLVDGVTCRTLECFGPRLIQVLIEAQRADLVLLGQHGDDGHGGGTLEDIVRDSPRPVVAVPGTLVGGDSVVVAYDGSREAARALYAFEASGLGRGRPVHVVSVGREGLDPVAVAGRAVEFLRAHDLDAVPHPIRAEAPVADAILNRLGSLEAGLLVMGACRRPDFCEFFLGSVTRSVLTESPIPLFCFH